MNTARLVQKQPSRTATPTGDSAPSRPAHRERDFGIGYGNSSGYGNDRRYAQSWAKSMFRCG